MNKKIIILFIIFSNSIPFFAQQFSYGDHWYDNPLGFNPINLHTKNGFLIPAIAVTVCLLATDKDSTLTNKLNFYNETGISWGYKYPHTTLYQNNTGAQFFLRNWMSVGLDIGMYFPNDKYNSTGGISVRPFARFYPVNNTNWRLYFESGGGLIYFFNQFPKPTDQDSRLGTNWNGTTRYGIGGEINFDQSFALLFGIRHVHVSNGNTSGVERNPSHDSNGMFIGLTYIP